MAERDDRVLASGNRQIQDPATGIRLVISPVSRLGGIIVGLALTCAQCGGHRHPVHITIGVN